MTLVNSLGKYALLSANDIVVNVITVFCPIYYFHENCLRMNWLLNVFNFNIFWIKISECTKRSGTFPIERVQIKRIRSRIFVDPLWKFNVPQWAFVLQDASSSTFASKSRLTVHRNGYFPIIDFRNGYTNVSRCFKYPFITK